jgi:hypothetical protein
LPCGYRPPDDRRFEHFDARPNGSYRLVLAYADASPREKSAVDSDVSTPWEATPSTPDHASTSGPTMCPTGSTLQITRPDCRPRWTISPLPLNAAEIHWQAADGDLVTTYKTYHGTHQGLFFGIAPTGREIHFETVDAMRVRNGQIVEHWGVANLLSLLQQLGAVSLTP